jgi:hypothetical protein
MHLTETEILLYLEGQLGPPARSRVECHVGRCTECASTFAGLSHLAAVIEEDIPMRVDEAAYRKAKEIIPQKKQSQWRRAQFFSTPYRIALAGIVLAVIGLTTYIISFHPEPVHYRSVEDRVPSLYLSPADGATITAVKPVFRWNRLPSSPVYEMSLMNEQGVIIWSNDVRDTVVALPTNVVLVRGKTYLWRVESFVADKRLERSALHAFTYVPAQ